MSTRRLARLKRLLKKHGITQDQVAAAVQPRPVDRSHVSAVLAGRFTSARVVVAAERLLAVSGVEVEADA